MASIVRRCLAIGLARAVAIPDSRVVVAVREAAVRAMPVLVALAVPVALRGAPVRVGLVRQAERVPRRRTLG